MSAQSLEVLDRALALSVEERCLLIDRLVESLDQAEEGIDRAWAEGIKRRVDDVRSRRLKDSRRLRKFREPEEERTLVLVKHGLERA
jgi:putative addiction module component (TIGR02574 family)